MKWIGQHIWDFISRFRSDVYLEGTESGTIASGGNLGLDSNNKVVKSASPSGTIDLTSSEVTGVLTVDHGGTGLSSIANNNLVTGNGSSALTAESSLIYDSETLTIGNDDDGEAHIKRLAHSDNHGGPLVIRAGDATAGQTDKNGGHLKLYCGQPTGSGTFGNFKFFAGDQEGTGASLRTSTQIAQLEGNAATSTDFTLYEKAGTSDDDYFRISVAEHGATTLSTVDDSSTNGDVTIDADGDIVLDSATGIIKTGSTTFVNNNGVIQVATQGTIDHDSLANFVAAEHYRWDNDIASTATVHTNNITDLHGAGVDGSDNQLLTDDGDGTVTSESYLTFINSSNISRMEFLSDQDTGDKCRISTTTHGATTIDTIDDDASAAHLSFDVDGDINSSSATNKISKTYDFHGTTFENTYSDGEASGTILKYSPGGDDTITASTLAYLRSNNGRWSAADADQASTSTGLLGVGLGGSAQTVGLLLEGFIRIASTEILNVPGSGEVDGLPVYISTTDGHFDFTPPSGSGDIVRVVGYAIDDDSGDVLIYFKPDNTWVEIA